jgi:hypothetical protein
MQVRGGILVELERAGQRRDDRCGRPDVATLLQPQVVVRADAGEHRDLLAPQSGDSATPAPRETDILRVQLFTTGAQERTQRRGVHPGCPALPPITTVSPVSSVPRWLNRRGCAGHRSLLTPATGERSEQALLGVSGWVRYEDLYVQTGAELALQCGPQAGEGCAVGMLCSRLFGLVLLDHDQSVAPLVERVPLDARLIVHSRDRRLEGRDHLGPVLGHGKRCGNDDDAHSLQLLPTAFVR